MLSSNDSLNQITLAVNFRNERKNCGGMDDTARTDGNSNRRAPSARKNNFFFVFLKKKKFPDEWEKKEMKRESRDPGGSREMALIVCRYI